jgi:hypothetical protein
LQETSELVFEVVGASGLPLSGENVTFSVNGTAGGFTVSPLTAISNSLGQVRTIVQSGSIPLVVNIIATVDSNGISTQSTDLVISAGLPDDDSFTLSADIVNPEALGYNGEEVKFTVQLADTYNNPSAGTPVYFTTEGGSVESSCSTDDSGQCTVTWRSANPRPADNRASVLAYTQGVESFIDQNGDGFLSDTEVIVADLAEVFRDDDEDTMYTIGEFFVDFNNNGIHDVGDNLYNGNLCNDTARCAPQTTLNISRSLVVVFSGSSANISATSDAATLADQDDDYQNELNISMDPATVVVSFSDTNGQPLPIGTTISVSADVGELTGTTSYTQDSTSVAGLRSFSFNVTDSDPDAAGDLGLATITVETPKGNETVLFFNVQE